jgi:serine/threonine protein kinase
MFEIIKIIGEGAYGRVFKVKCLKTSILNNEGTLLSPTMKMRKRVTKGNFSHTTGFSSTSIGGGQGMTRQLFCDQFYVIKEIDTAKWPKEVALE